MNTKVTTIIFLTMIFSIATINLFTPDRTMSESENRYLQTRPVFSWDSLARGKFTEDFDKYVTDQFMGRDEWVGLKTSTDAAAGKRSAKGVYFAADGYLIEVFDNIDIASFDRNLDYLRQFSETTEARFGVPVEVMLVPSSSGVLTGKLPAYAPELDQVELLRRADEILPHTVNLIGLLRERQGEYIYYKTDHHWTTLGAYYAYCGWREQKGEPFLSREDFAVETLSESFYGTTWSKARLYSIGPDTMEGWQPDGMPPVSVEYNRGEALSDSIYNRDYLEVKDKYSAYLNGNQPLSVIETGTGNGKTLLLIKDSYANAFTQLLLTDYEKIVVIDLRYYREPLAELLEGENITDILALYSLKGFAADVNLMFLAK